MKTKKMNDICTIQTEEDALNLLSIRARSLERGQSRLYHYTTFESLISIIKGKSFRLTRTDLLNDKAEMTIGDASLAKNHYIMSMTEGKEFVSMWAMYGRPSGIKIRLSFSKSEFINILDKYNDFSAYEQNIYHNLYIDNTGRILVPGCIPEKINLWDNKELDPLRFAYVGYMDKNKRVLRLLDDENNKMDFINRPINLLTGFVKYDAWKFEKEIRLLVELKTDLENKADSVNLLDHVYLPITDELIGTFSITFNPWLSQDMKKMIKSQLDNLSGKKLIYRDSINDGEIDENRI